MRHIKNKIVTIIGRWKAQRIRTKKIQAIYMAFVKNQVSLDKGKQI